MTQFEVIDVDPTQGAENFVKKIVKPAGAKNRTMPQFVHGSTLEKSSDRTMKKESNAKTDPKLLLEKKRMRAPR